MFNNKIIAHTFEGENFEDYQIAFNKKGTYEVPSVDLTNGLIDWSKSAKEICAKIRAF